MRSTEDLNISKITIGKNSSSSDSNWVLTQKIFFFFSLSDKQEWKSIVFSVKIQIISLLTASLRVCNMCLCMDSIRKIDILQCRDYHPSAVCIHVLSCYNYTSVNAGKSPEYLIISAVLTDDNKMCHTYLWGILYVMCQMAQAVSSFIAFCKRDKEQ